MLDELVPDFIDSIPPDMFDGQPLRYRLDSLGPVVYSIGTDRNDDGGSPAPEASRWLTPEEAARIEVEEPMQHDGDWIIFQVAEAADGDE